MLKSEDPSPVPWGTPLKTGISDDSTRAPLSLVTVTVCKCFSQEVYNPFNDVRVDATRLKLSFQP